MDERKERRSVHSTTRSESPSVESREAYDDDVPTELSVEREKTPLYDNQGHRWEYLTYETPLPDFTALSNDPSAPKPPNLKNYESPFGWSNSRKGIITAISSVATFMSAYSAGVYAYAGPILRARWSLSSVAYSTGVTCWCLGFAIAPMFLAPFSEINGRRPIFLASGLVFLVSDIGCAVTQSFAGMLVARTFQGIGASTFSTMIGGVLSDIYHAEDRNTPMAVYSSFALAGTGVGPMFGGLIIERVDWRWTWWGHTMAMAILITVMFLLFKETRGSVLLSRRAKKINKYYDQIDEDTRQNHPKQPMPSGNIRYKVASDESRATIGRMLYLSTTTPFKFLATEPVVFFFSLWAAFAWAVLFMAFNVIPYVYRTVYDFNVTQQSAIYTSIVVGTIIALFLSIYQDAVLSYTCFAHHLTPTSTPKPHNPESRLYLPCLLGPCLPIGLFWFGWTAQPQIHWIVPTIALGVAQMGIFTVYLAVFNYLADVYHRYASSALAGQSFCRNVLAAVFPLFVTQMFQRLGNGGAGSLLGALGLVLTLVPYVLVWKGEWIRSRSRIASEIMEKRS